MISLDVRPRPGSSLRAAWASAEIMVATTIAHTWAGGGLPSPLMLLVLTALVSLASRYVVTGRAPLRWAVVGMSAAQLALHLFLSAMSMPAMTMPAGHAVHSAGGAHVGWQMVAAHVMSAVVTALVWSLRRKLVRSLVGWPGLRAPRTPWRRLAPVLPVVVLPASRRAVLCTPWRGPPALALRA